MLATILLICTALLIPAHQDDERFTVAGLKNQEVETFFLNFKEAVGKSEKRKVAGMVSYPIRVTLKSGRRMRLANQAAFIRYYDQVLHEEFKQLIAATETKDLWAKSAGVATPRGEVWFSGIGKPNQPEDVYEIKIIALNGPMRP